jgi:hypothetical protein
MYDDPHAAAEELREELRTIPSDAAIALIRQTKVEETNYGTGGLGDLQIQVELDQRGCDSGYRNVIIATPEGPEQIAEFQSGAPICYDDQVNYNQSYRPDPLASITTMIIGNYLWQQQHNLLRDDSYYHGWHHRQQLRENHWHNHHGEWQNWQNQDFRRNIQQQDWQQFAWQPHWYQDQENVQRYYQQQPKQYYPQDGHDHRNGHALPTPDGEWHGHGNHRQNQKYWQQNQGADTYHPEQNQTQLNNLQKQQEALRLQKQQQDRLLRQQQGLIPGDRANVEIVPSNQQGNQYWRQGAHHKHQDNHTDAEQHLYSGQRQGHHPQREHDKDIQDQGAMQQQLLQQKQLELQQQKEAARQQQQLELLKQKQQETLQQQQEATKRQEQHEFNQQQLIRQKQQEALQQQRRQEEAAQNQQLPQAVPGNNAHRYQGGRGGLKM